MPKIVHTIPTHLMIDYNEGYHQGYMRQPPKHSGSDAYYRAYITGCEDRLEDNGAILLGEFDLLDADELKMLYGEEERLTAHRALPDD